MSASPESLSKFQEDALTLVQAQYTAGSVILGSESPVEVLRAILTFMGGQFGSGHLLTVRGEHTPPVLHLTAEGSPAVVRAADRRANLDDYPGGDRLLALEAVMIADLRSETSVSEAERQRLLARSVRSAVVLPLVAKKRLIGLLALFHTDPVHVTPARLHALYNLADQLAVVLENRRLLENAHTSAEQANVINGLVTRYQSAGSVDELLRLTLTELGQSLGAVRGAIRVGSAEVMETGGTAHD